MAPGSGEGDTLAPETGRARGPATGPAAAAEAPASGAWRRLLAEAIRDVDELWRVLALPAASLPAARASAGLFPLLVPRSFAALMRPGDLDDPLLRQVVPLAAEGDDAPGFSADPVAEAGCSPAPGLLAKYRGRALLIATGACAVHCRYCFRRHYPYGAVERGPRWWDDALQAIAADPATEELILSGGDPLTLPDAQLAQLAEAAAAIPHLRSLRLHTRLPVVLPERVDHALLGWLGASRLRTVVVIHANHARELSPSVVAACARLRAAGAMLLNQSVLLRGVNDDAGRLADLSHALADAGVVPYYLHLLDRVQGAAHFLVGDESARDIVRELAGRLPGYLVPRLVREEPGAPGKVPLAW